MKKILLSVAAVASISMTAMSQQRMTLHEEFTGENCGPCAATNPGFWTLLDGTTNPTKIIHIAYMDDIPSAGWYCDRNTALYTAMNTYYSVPFAPYGRYDGHVPDATCGSPAGASAGHPGCFVQADIDAEYAIASPFNMTVTNVWNAAKDSVTATITVTCVTAYSGTLYLRTALVETNNFLSSPGSNGETHFENVVQAVYPNVTGTAMAGTWTVGMTHTYTVAGAVPNYVDKSGSPFIVCWIQNDADKSIQQAAQGTPLPVMTNDVATTGSAGPSGLICATGTYSATHTVTLKNPGSAALTSAKIYYSVNGGAYTAYSWTGSLASGATTVVTMPAVSVPLTGSTYYSIQDSVAMPNGAAAINPVNNVSSSFFFVENTATTSLPYSTSFESSDSAYYSTDNANDGNTWENWYNTSTPLGHTGSHAMGAELGFFPSTNTNNTFILPELNLTNPTHEKISFWEAYAQIATTNTDALDVVYSTNCGSTWTSIWTLSGTSMATMPLNATTLVTPTAASNYAQHTASLSSIPAGSVIIGFKYTHGGGNSMWVDDINFINTTDVNALAAIDGKISIYPNPANNETALSFNLTENSDVQVQIVDALGRVLNSVANETMDAGAHTIQVNTSSLASGAYNMVIHTNGETKTEHFSIVK